MGSARKTALVVYPPRGDDPIEMAPYFGSYLTHEGFHPRIESDVEKAVQIVQAQRSEISLVLARFHKGSEDEIDETEAVIKAALKCAPPIPVIAVICMSKVASILEQGVHTLVLPFNTFTPPGQPPRPNSLQFALQKLGF